MGFGTCVFEGVGKFQIFGVLILFEKLFEVFGCVGWCIGFDWF